LVARALEDAVEAWLRPGPAQIIPGFPPALEAVFVEETAASRVTAMRISTAIGVAAGIFITPALWMLMPDRHAAIRIGWLLVGVPSGMACHALLYTKLNIRWQELQTAFVGLVVALAFSVVMTAAGAKLVSGYFGGIVLLMMLDVIAGGFSFRLGAAFAAALTVIFAVCVHDTPGGAGLAGTVQSGLMAVCCLFAVFGAWRLETETRRSWALMLRERMKRRALTHRNVELAELARRDPLTGLVNRRAYEMCEQASWRNAADGGVSLGLIMLDIDHFKSYNDFYGHAAGDLCLQAVSRCLAEQLRGNGDMVARIGGEEFAILLPDLGVETAGDIAERVRLAVAALELPHLGRGTSSTVTISCGACSLVPQPGMTPKDLFAAADAALYVAKQAGRNRVCLADQPPLGTAAPATPARGAVVGS
jgi:diguanylate cyclase (GGDEF)-like protein